MVVWIFCYGIDKITCDVTISCIHGNNFLFTILIVWVYDKAQSTSPRPNPYSMATIFEHNLSGINLINLRQMKPSFIPYVVFVNTIFSCADPNIPSGVFHDRLYSCFRYITTTELMETICLTIIDTKTIIISNPYISFIVTKNCIDIVAASTVIEMVLFYLTCVLIHHIKSTECSKPQMSFSIISDAFNVGRCKEMRMIDIVFITLYGISVITIQSQSGSNPYKSIMILNSHRGFIT